MSHSLKEILGIRYPILQGPLGGLNTQKLAAAVSNFGGLGSFGAHGLKPEVIRQVIAEIRALTSKPFAINLWVSMEDEGAHSAGPAEFLRSRAVLETSLQSLKSPLPEYAPYQSQRFEDQVQVLIEAKVPIFSFICGIPAPEILKECRRREIRTMGNATTPDEAEALQEAGVDVIVASGFEGGGHRGSFLRSSEESLMGLFSLLPQVVDRVRVPVVAAGGIADGRGLVAAFALGAQAVQVGTAFVMAKNSGAGPLYREALLLGKAGKTILTRGITGRLARGVENHLTELFSGPDVPILPYPLQRALVKSLNAAAEKSGRADFMQLWAGQSAGMSRFEDPIEFLNALLSQATAVAEKSFSSFAPGK